MLWKTDILNSYDKTKKINLTKNLVGKNNILYNEKLMMNENYVAIGSYIDISPKAIQEGRIGEIKNLHKHKSNIELT